MQTSSTLSYGKHGDLDTLVVDNDFARIELALFGAQVLSFVPKSDNRERLWLSPHADLSGEKPIRGGIPLCWPWFGGETGREDVELPSHGYLRTQIWTLQQHVQNSDGCELILKPATTAHIWVDDDFDVTLRIHVGASLTISLQTQNCGEAPARLNAALHSYFTINNVVSAEIKGISGEYKDKLDNWAIKQTPSPYQVHGETDRIHLCTAAQTLIQAENYETAVDHDGHDSIVVWNPWTSAASMPDMDAFGYKNMLCVETALTQWKTLNAGESHTLTQIIN